MLHPQVAPANPPPHPQPHYPCLQWGRLCCCRPAAYSLCSRLCAYTKTSLPPTSSGAPRRWTPACGGARPYRPCTFKSLDS